MYNNVILTSHLVLLTQRPIYDNLWKISLKLIRNCVLVIMKYIHYTHYYYNSFQSRLTNKRFNHYD